jgi:hypothetical protein
VVHCACSAQQLILTLLACERSTYMSKHIRIVYTHICTIAASIAAEVVRTQSHTLLTAVYDYIISYYCDTTDEARLHKNAQLACMTIRVNKRVARVCRATDTAMNLQQQKLVIASYTVLANANCC